MEKKFVSELYVNCSYPMSDDAIAASDNCNDPATSVVFARNGDMYYRCPAHRGLIDFAGNMGHVRYTVPTPTV